MSSSLSRQCYRIIHCIILIRDALRLSNWKKLGTKRKRKGEGSDENLNCDSQSSDDILEYLDANMTGNIFISL